MGDVLINSLMVGDCSERLCVRVSRTWDFYDPEDKTKLLHSDLVLIDEEIYPPITETFKPLIREGNVYNISFIQVKKANRYYKAVENDIMINFTRWTTIEEVVEVPPAFPLLTYSLTPMDKLPSLADSREYFVDVIGAVSTISGVTTLQTQGGQFETSKRTITILTEGGTLLDIVLWGERATSFPADQVHQNGQDSPQIIIFVGTLVKTYAGGISLSGGSSCKWYINPEVPETNVLLTSLGSMHRPIILAKQAAHSDPRPSTAEHKKISDIKYLHPFKCKKMEWLVTVKIMKIDSSWWYSSCKKCHRTARPHGNTYRCTNPTCGITGPSIPKYKLVIIAEDETGDTELVLFGRIAQRLIRKTADTLIASNPPGFIPDEITRLLERTFVFNISFTDNTITSGKVSFQVNVIVAEINDGSPLAITPTGSQASSVVHSQDTSGSSSFTGPLTATGSEATHASGAVPSKSNVHGIGPAATPRAGTPSSEDKGKAAEHTYATSEHARSRMGLEKSPISFEVQQSPSKKRTRSSSFKKTAKKLFTKDLDKGDVAGEPSSSEDNA